MKKWILIGVAVVIVIIVVLFVFGISKIGPLIKTAVNTYGPGITRTDLRLGDVGVSLFSGEVKLKEFTLGNPKGFTSPQAMKVNSIFVNVDEKSIMKDPIVIEKIEIAGPEITYEKTASSDNFMTIMDNVKKSAGMGQAPQEKPKATGKSRNLMVKEFVLKEGKVNLVAAFLAGKSVNAPLPDIRLTNIGSGKEGASPEKVAETILAAIYEKLTSSAFTASLNNQLKAMGVQSLEEATAGAKKQVEQTLGKGAGDEAGKLMDKAKGIFGK